MGAEDEQLERLRAALAELAAEDSRELLAEARAHARERARRILTDALTDSMLEGVRQLAHPEAAATEPAHPRAAAPDLAPSPAPAPDLIRTPGPIADPPPAGELGWYVYGVIAADSAPDWTLPGIDPAQSVGTMREGELAAVTSRVALEDFGEERLRAHLSDMGWVEATARAHEDVLEQTRSQVTVIPMRMCTVYREEAGLRGMLRREAESLSAALDHLDGKTEMGLKAFADPARVVRATVEAEPELEGAGAGAAYMDRRRRERDRAEEAAQQLERAAAEIHERMAALAADAHLAPPQRPEVSGRPGEMIVNGAYLVEDEALEDFRREVSVLQEAFGPVGIELELTGPWPAYNFVPGTIGAAW